MDAAMPFALNVFTLAIILFSANLLILRSAKRQNYLPLAICLSAIGLVICQPTLSNLAPSWQSFFLIISLPALLIIAPSFWYYVCGLTAEAPWRIEKVAKKHFVLASIGAVVAFVALLIPFDVRHSLLIEGNEAVLKNLSEGFKYLAYGALIATLLLVLAWVMQSGFYFYLVVKRLSAYREQLKNIFASTETKEIKWLSWLLFAIGIVWLAAAINIVLDNLVFSTTYSASLAGVVLLVMIWTVALWGLRQKPGFEEVYQSNNEVQAEGENQTNKLDKYQRSALSNEQANNIAEKIEAAMQNDELFLDASLSLQKLAKHTSTSPNYISQTLNESLGMNFFDYVNKYRVIAAKKLLVQSSDTVLDIAMNVGFNAKSSFYSAFKKETQQTPTQYRKAHRNSS